MINVWFGQSRLKPNKTNRFKKKTLNQTVFGLLWFKVGKFGFWQPGLVNKESKPDRFSVYCPLTKLLTGPVQIVSVLRVVLDLLTGH